MRAYTLGHLSDGQLLRDLASLVARDRATTAELIAHIAEVDSRRLYAPAGHPSMYEYCIRELHFSEHGALKRIKVARTAREFPAVFTALAEGRLHLSAVLLLGPHLNALNSRDLLQAATHKTKVQIEELLPRRSPRPDIPARLEVMAPQVSPAPQLAPGRVAGIPPKVGGPPMAQLAPGQVGTPVPRSKLTSVAPQRFALQLTISQETHDKLQHARALLSHRVPSGDLAQILDRVLDLAVQQLEKRKFAATDRPRRSVRRQAQAKRTIPAHVKRAVWERDQGRCTFTSIGGRRCSARRFLEFDHVDPVARGGPATQDNLRLRCRTHNQHEADQTFGAGFVNGRREAARQARRVCPTVEVRVGGAGTHRHAPGHVAPTPRSGMPRPGSVDPDVIACLRTLGFRADESRRAAAFSETVAGGSLEARVRSALSWFRPPGARRKHALAAEHT